MCKGLALLRCWSSCLPPQFSDGISKSCEFEVNLALILIVKLGVMLF